MRALPVPLLERWASARHIGAHRPTQIVKVRQGRFRHHYGPWQGPPVRAVIPQETEDNPWQATWEPTSDWEILPSVAQVSLDQDFSQKGMTTCTLAVENIVYRGAEAMGYLYHLRERGALSPFRGYAAPGRPNFGAPQNEWYAKLTKNSQIMVEQGYGDQIVPTFTGLIDQVDPESNPDRLTVVVRDFGQALVDQASFGRNVGEHIGEPLVFSPPAPKKESEGGPGKSVRSGHAAKASSTRKGHPARFVTDGEKDTVWISEDRQDDDVTEWVEVKLVKGKYTSILLHPGYEGMTAYISIKATDNMMGGERPEVDGANIKEGWVTILDEAGNDIGGEVPGGENSGTPYFLKLENLPAKQQVVSLQHIFEIGHNSILRVSFRKLKHISGDTYRASCVRLKGLRKKGKRVHLKQVAKNAGASSSRTGHPSSLVIDPSQATRWISEDRSSKNLTEFVEIHVPQGRYDSFILTPKYPHMNMYVGVFARPRHRKDLATRRFPMACEVDDERLMAFDPSVGIWRPTVQQQWIDLTHPPFNLPASGNADIGVVPGPPAPAGNGGWPHIKYVADVEIPSQHKPEKYMFGHKLELGNDSIIRLGFRNLYEIDTKDKTGTRKRVYRASVGKFKANARLKVVEKKSDDPDAEGADKDAMGPDRTKIIVINDLADIVRCVLRWAGFKEWIVEDTGWGLTGKWTFTRKDKLMDIIDRVTTVTGFQFFIMPPLDADNSIGMPVFRQSQVLRDDLPVQLVRDSDLVTSVHGKISDEPLHTLIRIFGKTADGKKGGHAYGAQRTKRLMGTYIPPWVRGDRMGGLLKHFTYTEDRLDNQASVDVYARLFALQEALASATATFSVPGAPQLDLDDQIGLLDVSTGLNTRVWIAQLQSVFTTGENASWFTTVGGALLDTPDVAEVKADLLEILPQGVASMTNAFVGLEND